MLLTLIGLVIFSVGFVFTVSNTKYHILCSVVAGTPRSLNRRPLDKSIPCNYHTHLKCVGGVGVIWMDLIVTSGDKWEGRGVLVISMLGWIPIGPRGGHLDATWIDICYHR